MVVVTSGRRFRSARDTDYRRTIPSMASYGSRLTSDCQCDAGGCCYCTQRKRVPSLIDSINRRSKSRFPKRAENTCRSTGRGVCTCGCVSKKVPGIFRTIHEIANVSALPSVDSIDYTLENVMLDLSSISGLSDLFNYKSPTCSLLG